MRASAASRKSLVGIAVSVVESTGTLAKDLRSVSNHVPPAGKVFDAGMDIVSPTKSFNESDSRLSGVCSNVEEEELHYE